jgi:hypothetical protein
VFDSAQDGITISGGENSVLVGVATNVCARDGFAFTHGAKNWAMLGCFSAIAGQSSIHVVQRGVSSNNTFQPEKLQWWGGVFEEWDETGAFLGTVYVEQGDLLQWHSTTLSGGSHGNTTGAAVHVAASGGNAMRLAFYGGQISALTGFGINAGGGTTAQPVQLYLAGGILARSASATAPWLQIRDNNIRVASVGPIYWQADVRYATSGTATRVLGDVMATNGARTVLKTADTARTVDTIAADPHLSVQVEANTDYEISGLLIIDGDPAGDLTYGFTAPTGATLDWTPLANGQGATNEVSTLTRQYLTVTNTIGVGTVAVGTKTAAEFRGLLRVGSTAGTFELRWGQRVTSATATTLYTRSYLTLRRL